MIPLALCGLLALPAAAPDAPERPAAEPAIAAPALATGGASGPRAAPDTLEATLHGRVLSEATGAPVPFARVALESSSFRRSVLSDSLGRYRLEEIPAGARQLRIRAPGHLPMEVLIDLAGGDELAIDVVLPIHPIELPEITAVGRLEEMGDRLRLRATSLRGAPDDPELRALEASPAMAQLGFRNGGRGPPEEDGSGLLHVRGSASDFKLVLLDGAPVYAPFHLAGLDRAFHPDVLETARLYVGSAPARFGGALSHVLLLETRRGNGEGLRTAGAMDLLGARARVEGAMGRSISYLAAARGLHGGEPGGLTNGGLPYGYEEALGRLDLDLAPATDLSVTGFRNRERVRFDDATTPWGSARWGNSAGSVRLRTRLGPRDAIFTAAIGRFESHLPLNGGEPGFRSGAVERVRLAADLSRREGPVRIGYGGFYDRDAVVLRTGGRSGESAEGSDGVDEVTAAGAGWRVGTAAEEAGLYGEVTWRPVEELSVRGGLRAGAFLTSGEIGVGPRLAAEWRVAESSVLSAAGGRYHQYLRPPESILSAAPSTPGPEPGALSPAGSGAHGSPGDALTVADASHVVVGLRHHPREELALGMEGFYKIFRGIPGATEADVGRRASGVDLWFERDADDWSIRAGYSLLFSWLEGGDPTTARRFSGRQLLTAAVEAPLPSGLDLELRLANAAGLPFTALPTAAPTGPETSSDAPDSTSGAGLESTDARAGDELTSDRSGSYLRLDARISGTWSTSLLGADLRLTPYLRVLNALDRRDALFYRFGGENAGTDEGRALSSIPLLPVIGVEWRM